MNGHAHAVIAALERIWPDAETARIAAAKRFAAATPSSPQPSTPATTERPS